MARANYPPERRQEPCLIRGCGQCFWLLMVAIECRVVTVAHRPTVKELDCTNQRAAAGDSRTNLNGNRNCRGNCMEHYALRLARCEYSSGAAYAVVRASETGVVVQW